MIVAKFVIPTIVDGRSPVEVAIIGAFAVMLMTMPLSYGLGAKMLAALLGTAASLLVAAALAHTFAQLAHLLLAPRMSDRALRQEHQHAH